jgi:uncharacterized MAPEG superfamily protein
MSSLNALIGFGIWTLVLVLIAVGWRVIEVLRGKPADSWGRGSTTARPAFITRAEHAHLNCIENLPVFGAIVLAGAAMGKSSLIDAYAPIVLYARIGQSVIHLIGVNHVLVLIRATLYSVQVALFLFMALKLLSWV